jgi:Fe-S oxidoreductase
MVTLEEKHSTRGRARLLFEMLERDPLGNGWKEEEVKDALDLCLACKGCLGDCPVNVDMATYKAEFLSHYYRGRVRPRAAYSMGLIHWWARLACRTPRMANRVGQGRLTAGILKSVAGVASERRLPVFAEETFKDWFFGWGDLSWAARRGGPDGRDESGKPSAEPSQAAGRGARPRPGSSRRPAVVLWPDTFTNHLYPAAGRAAVPVLEAAGYKVISPRESLCCGRPLYDWGMLDLAKRLLTRVLRVLGPHIDAGLPVVGLEPSCTAVFRNELVNLFPEVERARRLASQTYSLAEFLELAVWRPPKLDRAALLHGHCHHKAIMTTAAEDSLLGSMGLRHTILDSGCCGMAGSFGFEKHHYEVSVAAGERVLLPAVRAAEQDTLIVADGFSCREQIGQLTGRHAVHLAEVLNLALLEDEGESDTATV